MKTNPAPLSSGTRGRASAPARARRALAVLTIFLLAAVPARAQWLTQTVTLKPGWNAVFLHVDASHILLDDLITGAGNPITEIWQWQPPVSTAQFATTPQQPTVLNSQWAVWDRSPVVSDSLVRLSGNGAYLVRGTNTTDFVWSLKGRPVPPRYQWTSTGLNFLGFPTPAAAAPNFNTFLAPAPELQRSAEIYRYPGGEAPGGAPQPARVATFQFQSTPVTRGTAFWIRADVTYNRYFGPFEVQLQNNSGINFGDALGTSRVRLKNLTVDARTITLNLGASETPPTGQTPIVGAPPLLVRGALNTANLSYSHTVLSGPQSFNLAPRGQPGSELEVVLGLNRSAMPAAEGSLYAGVLRFTDADGLEQIDVPVTAQVGGTAGLWVGGASVNSVNQYLKTYAHADQPADVPATNSSGFAVASLPGTTWTPQPAAGNRRWFSLASSADGSRLLAAASFDKLYTSTDAGVTWTARLTDTNRFWQVVASSADGVKLVAAVNPGVIFTSADSGETWAAQTNSGSRIWTSLASSADGAKLVAGVSNGQLYTSTDSGVTWTARDSIRGWYAVASSADGTRLVAAARSGRLYTSTDSGVTWTPRETNRLWLALASSADGAKLAAAVNPGFIFTSVDSGETWATQTNSGSNVWASLASSADGSKLVAAAQPGQLFTSTDSGVTWTARDTNRNWRALTSSESGERLVAGVDGGFLYTSTGTFTTFQQDPNSGLVVARSAAGSPYLATATNNAPGKVVRGAPLRLIVMADARYTNSILVTNLVTTLSTNIVGTVTNVGTNTIVGTVTNLTTNVSTVVSSGFAVATNSLLLQRIYQGLRGASDLVLATRESVLAPATLASARRLSAVHLPFSTNNVVWPKSSGQFRLGSSLVFNVALDYNDHASNPFLHTYHPDHDNLTPDFSRVETQGAESYGVNRQITLTFTPPGTDFASLTAAAGSLGGTYSEVITFSGRPGNSRQFYLSGTFSLNRVSSISTLTTP